MLLLREVSLETTSPFAKVPSFAFSHALQLELNRGCVCLAKPILTGTSGFSFAVPRLLAGG